MRKNLILLLAFVAVLVSCSEDEYTVTLKESGKLTAQLTQNGTAISGETVYLIPESSVSNKDSKSSLIAYSIDYKETDENGNVDFGEVNSGNYYVATDGIEISGKTYYPSKVTQVVSGGTREVTMDVMDYTGTIELTVLEYDYNYYDYMPVSGVKVAILDEDDYSNANSFDDWMDSKIEESTTDSNGEVSFTLPSGTYYVAVVYITDSYGDVTDYDTEYLTYLDMDEEYSETMYVYFY